MLSVPDSVSLLNKLLRSDNLDNTTVKRINNLTRDLKIELERLKTKSEMVQF